MRAPNLIRSLCSDTTSRRDAVLLGRNYDPETRTIRKHARNEALLEDTVEKNVEGMAQMIISEDEQRRAQELVGYLDGRVTHSKLMARVSRMYSTSLQRGLTGI